MAGGVSNMYCTDYVLICMLFMYIYIYIYSPIANICHLTTINPKHVKFFNVLLISEQTIEYSPLIPIDKTF